MLKLQWWYRLWWRWHFAIQVTFFLLLKFITFFSSTRHAVQTSAGLKPQLRSHVKDKAVSSRHHIQTLTSSTRDLNRLFYDEPWQHVQMYRYVFVYSPIWSIASAAFPGNTYIFISMYLGYTVNHSKNTANISQYPCYHLLQSKHWSTVCVVFFKPVPQLTPPRNIIS